MDLYYFELCSLPHVFFSFFSVITGNCQAKSTPSKPFSLAISEMVDANFVLDFGVSNYTHPIDILDFEQINESLKGDIIY